MIDYRHITKKEIEELNLELETIKGSIDKNYWFKSLLKNLLYVTIIAGASSFFTKKAMIKN